jgi:hypothetical protein
MPLIIKVEHPFGNLDFAYTASLQLQEILLAIEA